MKTKVTLFALCFLAISNLWAVKHQVATITEFNSAWSTYAAGDTIVVAPGTYALGGDKTFTKSVTIMASDTLAASKPALIGGGFIFGTLTANTSLVINGIEAYFYEETATVTDSKYFIQAVSTNIASYTIPLLSVRNSKIHGYSRGMVRADNSTATNMPNITMLYIDNCLVYDISRVRADYSIFACKSAKVSNVVIKNSTFYNSPAGVWYNENTDTQVNFLMENCCLIKITNSTTTGVQTNASKFIMYNNTNPNSVHRIKNTIISDSFDGTTTNMQIKLGTNNTDCLGHIDNVIFGNNMNSTILNSTTLTTDNRVAVSSFSYSYPTLTLNIGASVTAIGDPRWTINNITTGNAGISTISAKVYLNNGNIYCESLPQMSQIEVFSINGRRLHTSRAVATTMIIPVAERNAIVRISANGKSETYKLGF